MTDSAETGDGRADGNDSYTVVLRCADAHFRVPAGQMILISPITSEHGNMALRVLTRTDAIEGIETPIPREIWIEVTGPAPSLNIAVNTSASTANDFIRQVAFGANAWHGLINVHLAFNNTSGRQEREFFQNWVPDERGLPRQARDVDPDLMYRLLAAIATSKKRERPRILRAITQYTDALQYWKQGNDLYALAHLYMGVEAITESVIRAEVRRRGFKKRKELEVELNGPPAESFLLRLATFLYVRAGGRRKETLASWARLELIFCRDKETYSAAKKASDGLEHGFAAHREVQRLAKQCVEKTAEYLRKSILLQIEISDDDFIALTSKPYERPTNTGGFERQFLATIVSDDEDVAAPDQAYPFVRWQFNLKEFSFAEDGGHKMRVTQTMKPMISESAVMRFERIHFAGSTETTHNEVELKIEKDESDTSESGVTTALNNPANEKWLHPLGGFISNCNSIRRLSIFWIHKLSITTDGDSVGFSFSKNVKSISEFFSSRELDEDLKDRCMAEWQRALELDQVRLAFAGATTGENGLSFFDDQVEGEEKLITDIAALKKLIDKSVGLAQSLTALLDEVLASLPMPSNDDSADGAEKLSKDSDSQN